MKLSNLEGFEIPFETTQDSGDHLLRIDRFLTVETHLEQNGGFRCYNSDFYSGESKDSGKCGFCVYKAEEDGKEVCALRYNDLNLIEPSPHSPYLVGLLN